MAISMYSGFVPVCLQLLGGLKRFLAFDGEAVWLHGQVFWFLVLSS